MDVRNSFLDKLAPSSCVTPNIKGKSGKFIQRKNLHPHIFMWVPAYIKFDMPLKINLADPQLNRARTSFVKVSW